jgi:hypothetical protein
MAEPRNSPSDPLASWREWMSQSEVRLNGLFNELMATDSFGRVMGLVTRAMVSMQDRMTEGMERYFSALSLPTRSDVIDIAKRLASIESRLHAIESRVARRGGSAPAEDERVVLAPRPPRTRKPANETRKPANGRGGAP